MATIHQHGKLHTLGSADRQNGINGSPAAPSRVQNIVHDHHTLILYRKMNGTPGSVGGIGDAVIPKRRDVQCAKFYFDLFQFVNFPSNPFRKHNATGQNAHDT